MTRDCRSFGASSEKVWGSRKALSNQVLRLDLARPVLPSVPCKRGKLGLASAIHSDSGTARRSLVSRMSGRPRRKLEKPDYPRIAGKAQQAAPPHDPDTDFLDMPALTGAAGHICLTRVNCVQAQEEETTMLTAEQNER